MRNSSDPSNSLRAQKDSNLRPSASEATGGLPRRILGSFTGPFAGDEYRKLSGEGGQRQYPAPNPGSALFDAGLADALLAMALKGLAHRAALTIRTEVLSVGAPS